MSFERMIDDVKVCDCGEGTITYVNEMDDWNETRSRKEFQCTHCEAEYKSLLEKREQNREKRELLLKQAQELAKDRYLEKWLEHFRGHSKKRVWEMLTVGKGYPALGTFYNHVKDKGLDRYLENWLSKEVSGSLDLLNIADQEVSDILKQRDIIPEYREPHPWQ